MGATVLFTLMILPVLFSLAFVLVLVMGRMKLAASEPAYKETEVTVYAPSPAVLAFE